MFLTLRGGVPQEFNFGWSGINQVRFVPLVVPNAGSSMQFAVTELVVNGNPTVPEPSTFFLLAPGLGLALTRLGKFRIRQ